MTVRPALFQDFIRADLGIGWIFAVALGIGLLAGSIGKFMQLPQEVFAFDRALEKAELYEFFYDHYLVEAKFKSPELITREEQAKVERLQEIMKSDSPGFIVAMLMLIVGLLIVLLFAIKLGAALHKRIYELEQAMAGGDSQDKDSDADSDKESESDSTDAEAEPEAK